MIDWISVEDRLPEDYQEVFIILDNGTVQHMTWKSHNVESWIYKPQIKYWYPYNPPVKKRWKPVDEERVFRIDATGYVFCEVWHNDEDYKDMKSFTGVFKTREEALTMRDKIREFVTGIIGSV